MTGTIHINELTPNRNISEGPHFMARHRRASACILAPFTVLTLEDNA
jgi:hypothetical protein